MLENEKETKNEAGQKMEADGEKKIQKKRAGVVRKVFGVLIIVMGIGVCAYPMLRQKKSDDFNKQAIDMILTPKPTKEAEPTKVQPEITPTNQPTVSVQASPEAEPTKEPEVTQEADITATPEPTPTDKPNRLNGQDIIGVIQIDAIDLVYAIVEGADSAEIGVAIGHMSGTAELGAVGNCALAGHRGGYSGPYFKDLDKLKAGDEVRINDAHQNQFVYRVTESFIVQPTDTWVAEDIGDGKAYLTLVTCEDNGNTRLIVRCELSN